MTSTRRETKELLRFQMTEEGEIQVSVPTETFSYLSGGPSQEDRQAALAHFMHKIACEVHAGNLSVIACHGG